MQDRGLAVHQTFGTQRRVGPLECPQNRMHALNTDIDDSCLFHEWAWSGRLNWSGSLQFNPLTYCYAYGGMRDMLLLPKAQIVQNVSPQRHVADVSLLFMFR